MAPPERVMAVAKRQVVEGRTVTAAKADPEAGRENPVAAAAVDHRRACARAVDRHIGRDTDSTIGQRIGCEVPGQGDRRQIGRVGMRVGEGDGITQGAGSDARGSAGVDVIDGMVHGDGEVRCPYRRNGERGEERCEHERERSDPSVMVSMAMHSCLPQQRRLRRKTARSFDRCKSLSFVISV